MQVNQRSSNFELLRIILMLMVIVLHYFNGGMGGLFGNVEKWSFNYVLSHFIESFCIIAVNVFIIITGYFSYKKTSIKISKSVNLYMLSIFYGIVIAGIVIYFTKLDINISLIKRLVNVMFSRWFVVTYCILYLLIPYLNKFLSALSKRQLEILFLINAIFFYLWPTFFTDNTMKDAGYGIVNFVNLYMVGAYIRMYGKEKASKTKCLLIYIICSLLTAGYSFWSDKSWAYSTIFTLISSIAFFDFFRGLKFKNYNIINKLASYTFAVYIIHENNFLTQILFRKIFKSDLFWNSKYMILNLAVSVIGIYVICIAIEFVRRLLFKKIIDNNIDKIKYEIRVD